MTSQAETTADAPKLSRSVEYMTRDAVSAYPSHTAQWLATISGQCLIAAEAVLSDPSDRKREHLETSRRLTTHAWADFLDACALTERDPAHVLRSRLQDYQSGPLLDELPRRLAAHNAKAAAGEGRDHG